MRWYVAFQYERLTSPVKRG